MEGESSKPLTTDVPRFARGLSILLIHNDTSTLVNLKILLHEKYSFQVTATSNTSAAVSMILEDKGGFKMIMSKANMPGVDAPAFMYLMLGKRIPVIFILSGRIDDVNREKARARSCYFIDEPILLDKLQCILQEMYQSKLIYKECQDITAQESPQHSNNTEVDGEIRNHGKGKGKKYKSRMKRTENDRRKSDLGAVKSSSCSSDKAKFRSPAEGSSTGAQGVSLPAAADQTQSEIVTVSNGGDSECTTVKVAMTKEQPAVASMDPPANEDDDLEVDSDTFGDWFSNNGITPPLYEMDEYTANLNNIFESPTPP